VISKNPLLLWTIPLLLAGCGAPLDRLPGSDRPAAPTPAPQEPPAPQAMPPAAERLRGTYAQPGQWLLCGAPAGQAVHTSDANRQELQSFGAPRFFLDGWGRRTAQGLELIEIERMHLEGPDCREPIDNFAWVAHGEEPFWAFGITTSGMRFKVAGRQARLYPYVSAQASDSRIVYRGDAYTLTLEKKVCHGTMAQARYAWTATLQAEGRSWSGCAWQGMQQERQDAPDS